MRGMRGGPPFGGPFSGPPRGRGRRRRGDVRIALLLLLVRLVDLLELLDNFFHLLASRGFPFGLFNPVNKPLFLGVRQLFKQAIRH